MAAAVAPAPGDVAKVMVAAAIALAAAGIDACLFILGNPSLPLPL